MTETQSQLDEIGTGAKFLFPSGAFLLNPSFAQLPKSKKNCRVTNWEQLHRGHLTHRNVVLGFYPEPFGISTLLQGLQAAPVKPSMVPLSLSQNEVKPRVNKQDVACLYPIAADK